MRQNSIYFSCSHSVDFARCLKNLSTIVSEKLDKDNFQAWKFMMTNFFMGKGVWPFINGDEQEPVLGAAPTAADLKTLKSGMKRIRWSCIGCQLVF